MNESIINATSLITGHYNMYENYKKIEEVSTWLIVTIGLILMPVAIFALSSLVKKDNVAPIFVINLLVSDVVQLCSLILLQTDGTVSSIGDSMYSFSVVASVGFMVCIALERYLAIVWPLWYRTRRPVKMSLLLCAVVWTFPLFYLPLSKVMVSNGWLYLYFIISGILLLLPLPLLVFFLVGTLRALSASISVRAEENRRIVGLLVLVLLIYTLLFLPSIIFYLVHPRDLEVHFVAVLFSRLNPIADLFMYIFLRKGAVNHVWFCLCCCRKNRTIHQSSGLNVDKTVTTNL
ncbi:G-protein coupled receptor 4-like [Betta splendens]|uniref:G-protein coupled receptor 4-like n=1 Tax=Betta splendens TaxID=158456 RepID=A0A6P7NZ70_BETSP|nr:G-protein coupled receptor 4-like [Betta splendens]